MSNPGNRLSIRSLGRSLRGNIRSVVEMVRTSGRESITDRDRLIGIERNLDITRKGALFSGEYSHLNMVSPYLDAILTSVKSTNRSLGVVDSKKKSLLNPLLKTYIATYFMIQGLPIPDVGLLGIDISLPLALTYLSIDAARSLTMDYIMKDDLSAGSFSRSIDLERMSNSFMKTAFAFSIISFTKDFVFYETGESLLTYLITPVAVSLMNGFSSFLSRGFGHEKRTGFWNSVSKNLLPDILASATMALSGFGMSAHVPYLFVRKFGQESLSALKGFKNSSEVLLQRRQDELKLLLDEGKYQTEDFHAMAAINLADFISKPMGDLALDKEIDTVSSFDTIKQISLAMLDTDRILELSGSQFHPDDPGYGKTLFDQFVLNRQQYLNWVENSNNIIFKTMLQAELNKDGLPE